jgi:hypothetical protein
MKSRALSLACSLLLCARAALGLAVGDTYDHVVAEKGDPKSQMQVGARRIVTYPDAVVKFDNDVVVSVRYVAPPTPTPEAETTPTPAPSAPDPDGIVAPTSVADAMRRIDKAVARVRDLVNRPVESAPITPELRQMAGVFREGWFPQGAQLPAFSGADIRKSQDLSLYTREEWCTSSLTLDRVFKESQCEFNPQTKFFYMDYSLPKKRLTDEEMQEVNRLYHQIGAYASYMEHMGRPWTPNPGF